MRKRRVLINDGVVREVGGPLFLSKFEADALLIAGTG